MRALALLAAAVLCCAYLRPSPKDKTLCEESRDLVCLTVATCTMDEARGCRVCQCSSAMQPVGGRPEDYGQPGVPRDRNQAP